MFDGNFELVTILKTGPDNLARIIVRTGWDDRDRESLLVDAREAELLVFRRWTKYHQDVLGFPPTWGVYAC